MSNRPLFSILHATARPDAWRKVYDDWTRNADDRHQVEYVLAVDSRWGFDARMVRDAQEMGIRVVENTSAYRFSGYVSSVNLAAAACTGNILIVNADDQFSFPAWDTALLKAIGGQIGRHEYFPLRELFDGTKQEEYLVSVSTGTPKEHERSIMVMPVLSRARYEHLGYVFYPGYESMFADNDILERGRQDGCVIEAHGLEFPHRHWINNQRLQDRADAAQNARGAYDLGEKLLNLRRANGFGPVQNEHPGEGALSAMTAGPESILQTESSETAATGAAATDVAASGKRTIALCLLGDDFRGRWLDSILLLYGHLIARGFDVIRLRGHFLNRFTTNIYVAREEIRRAALACDPKPELLLWIDDDNLCSPEDFDRLLSDLDGRPDLDGVTAWCWIHDEDGRQLYSPSCGSFEPTGVHWRPFASDFAKHRVLCPVEATGFPCFLMRLSAIEKAGDNPFIRGILDERLPFGIMGEDLAFCKAAMEGGAKFAVDPLVRVPHLKSVQMEPVFTEDGAPDLKIAVMLRVRNEARWIARVVKAALTVGPVYLMDDGSKDGTPELARAAGAEVLDSPFSHQALDECRDKNWLLDTVKEECSPDWVLCIDGDEELLAGSADAIRRACAKSRDVDVFSIRVLNLWDSPDQARFDGVYGQMARFSLFRPSDDVRFESFYQGKDGGKGKPPHVGLHTSNAPMGTKRELVGAALNVWLIHYGYLFQSDRLRKFRWYNEVDPENQIEDGYRHIVQGDIPEVPATLKLKHAGPLELRKLPRSFVPDIDMAALQTLTETHEANSLDLGAPAKVVVIDRETPVSDVADLVISILHPTARLPEGWKQAAESWRFFARHPERIEYILCVDEGALSAAAARDLLTEVSRLLSPMRVELTINRGRRCFVDAVNQAASVSRGKLLVQAEDDYFPCENWDARLLAAIPDLTKPYTVMADAQFLPGLMGAAIMTRAYYEIYGYLYYPEYFSMGADNDLTERAIRDGAMLDCSKSIQFEHRHPGVGKAELDDVYRAEQSDFAKLVRDVIWPRRRQLNYPIGNQNLMPFAVRAAQAHPGISQVERCGQCGVSRVISVEPHATWCGQSAEQYFLRLNLGCCDRHEAGFINVDRAEPADKIVDLREYRWPWDDSSVDEIRAWDVFEHLPDKIHTMNEAFRILKPGGRLDIIVPTTEGRGAWQDPTHVSYWNRNTFFYFESGNPHLSRFSGSNGVRCAFRTISVSQESFPDEVVKLHIVLGAVKDSLANAAD